MSANRVADSYPASLSRSGYRAATRLGAGLIILASSLTAAGCSAEQVTGSPARSSASPSTETPAASECTPPDSKETKYGVHFGIMTDITPKLLGEQGSAIQDEEWDKMRTWVNGSLDHDEMLLGKEYVLSVGVGYTDHPKEWADQRASDLAHLAIQELSMSQSLSYGNTGYDGQDDIATLHIRGSDAPGGNHCSDLA